MTRIYFVRHAQPVHSHRDDRTRPLTAEGMTDAGMVLELLKDKQIRQFYCSPYQRSMDTIRGTAEYYHMPIHTDERLRERVCGDEGGNALAMLQKRWQDLTFHEPEGESIGAVQERNIEALNEILDRHPEQNIVIGTHGTALSAILNYYKPAFGFEDFMRLIDWMPYVVEMDFNGRELMAVIELGHIYKEFNG